MSVRRIVLDDILVRRVRGLAGVELREGFAVDDLLWEAGQVAGVRGHYRDGGRAAVEERARVVVGADGRHSLVARLVGAAEYDVVSPILATYYQYLRGVVPLAEPALEAYRDDRGGYCYLFPCDGGAWVVAVSIPQRDFPALRRDHERGLGEQIARKPALAERLQSATPLGPWRGAGDVVNFFRVPYGPGWALVGDAGYHRDPITARGIPDALQSAERLAAALDRAWRAELPWEESLAAYQAERDAWVKPLYDLTCDRPPAGVDAATWGRYLARILSEPDHLSAYIGLMATVMPPGAFYSAEAVRATEGETLTTS